MKTAWTYLKSNCLVCHTNAPSLQTLFYHFAELSSKDFVRYSTWVWYWNVPIHILSDHIYLISHSFHPTNQMHHHHTGLSMSFQSLSSHDSCPNKICQIYLKALQLHPRQSLTYPPHLHLSHCFCVVVFCQIHDNQFQPFGYHGLFHQSEPMEVVISTLHRHIYYLAFSLKYTPLD